MKIKLFESSVSSTDLENKIAEWISPLNGVKIISTSLSVTPIVEYYEGVTPLTVYGNWRLYVLTIVYDL